MYFENDDLFKTINNISSMAGVYEIKEEEDEGDSVDKLGGSFDDISLTKKNRSLNIIEKNKKLNKIIYEISNNKTYNNNENMITSKAQINKNFEELKRKKVSPNYQIFLNNHNINISKHNNSNNNNSSNNKNNKKTKNKSLKKKNNSKKNKSVKNNLDNIISNNYSQSFSYSNKFNKKKII